MAVDTATSFPTTVTAGDTIRVKLSAGSSHPASSWTGHLSIVGDGTDKRATWSADGDDHSFVFSGSSTASWVAGLYTWSFLVVENSSAERLKIRSGTFHVIPDPLAKVPAKTHNEKVLDALRKLQLNRVDDGAAENFSIDGQSFTMVTARELTRQIGIYEIKVRREKNRNLQHGAGRPRRVLRFG